MADNPDTKPNAAAAQPATDEPAKKPSTAKGPSKEELEEMEAKNEAAVNARRAKKALDAIVSCTKIDKATCDELLIEINERRDDTTLPPK